METASAHTIARQHQLDTIITRRRVYGAPCRPPRYDASIGWKFRGRASATKPKQRGFVRGYFEYRELSAFPYDQFDRSLNLSDVLWLHYR